MTQTTKTELEKKIKEACHTPILRSNDGTVLAWDDITNDDQIANLVALIEQECLRARINEIDNLVATVEDNPLIKHYEDGSVLASDKLIREYVADRLARLKDKEGSDNGTHQS